MMQSVIIQPKSTTNANNLHQCGSPTPFRRRPSKPLIMPRLTNRLHERFCWLVAEGLDRKAAYTQLAPHANNPGQIGYQLYKKADIKARIAEIQTEVNCRSLMAIDNKRDLLRQMIEGTVPTKVVKRADGKLEATFDRLGALMADAKLAGELADNVQPDAGSDVKLTFEVYHRNHPNPPREWMEAIVVAPEAAELSYNSAPMDQPGLDDILKQSATSPL